MISVKPDISFEVADQLGGKLVCHYYLPSLENIMNKSPIQDPLSEAEPTLQIAAKQWAIADGVTVEEMKQTFDAVINKGKRDYAIRVEYYLRSYLKEIVEASYGALINIIYINLAPDATDVFHLNPQQRNQIHKKRINKVIKELGNFFQTTFRAGKGRQFFNDIAFFFRFWNALDSLKEQKQPITIEVISDEMGYQDVSGLKKALKILDVTFEQAIEFAEVRNTLRYKEI